MHSVKFMHFTCSVVYTTDVIVNQQIYCVAIAGFGSVLFGRYLLRSCRQHARFHQRGLGEAEATMAWQSLPGYERNWNNNETVWNRLQNGAASPCTAWVLGFRCAGRTLCRAAGCYTPPWARAGWVCHFLKVNKHGLVRHFAVLCFSLAHIHRILVVQYLTLSCVTIFPESCIIFFFGK
jgi:hypothetical protein